MSHTFYLNNWSIGTMKFPKPAFFRRALLLSQRVVSPALTSLSGGKISYKRDRARIVRRFLPNGQIKSGKGCLSTSWQLKCPQLGGGQMAHRSNPPAARLMSADRTTELTTHSRKQYAHAVLILNQANKSRTTNARVSCRCWQLHCQIAMRGRILIFHSAT